MGEGYRTAIELVQGRSIKNCKKKKKEEELKVAFLRQASSVSKKLPVSCGSEQMRVMT